MKNLNNGEGGFTTKISPNIFYTPMTQHYYSVAFTDDIEDPSFYDSVINLLLTAEDGTQIDFLISSYGGRMDSFIALRGAIQATKAVVTGYLMAHSCSAAGMLFLSCHNWVVNEFSTFHAHTCSYGSYGKSDDVKQQVDYVTAQTERIVRSVYDGVLSLDEQDSLLNGKEFYFDDQEISRRLEQREAKHRTSLQQPIDDEITLEVFTNEELAEELKLIQAEIKKRKTSLKKTIDK